MAMAVDAHFGIWPGDLEGTERVSVDSCKGRVTAITVDTHLGIWPQDVERKIRVPMGAVRCMNASGVELNMTAGEAIHCTDLEPQVFVTPDPSTLLPYGYLYSEVPLESGGTNCQPSRGQSFQDCPDAANWRSDLLRPRQRHSGAVPGIWNEGIRVLAQVLP
jgi:hypothetical protein